MDNSKNITPNGPANFTPSLGNYKDLQPFRYWCYKILPMVYDDSLSYYELLCKVVDYLNKTMEDVETLHGDVSNLHTAYEELQGYVNNYFSTLDVQEEINNKLDNMASSGELYEIIRKYTDPIVNEQNEKINVLKSRMDTFTSLPNGSTTGDAELTDIRVGYNGRVYPTAGDAVRDQNAELNIDLSRLSNLIRMVSDSMVNPNVVTIPSPINLIGTFEAGGIQGNNGEPNEYKNAFRNSEPVSYVANVTVKPLKNSIVYIHKYYKGKWIGQVARLEGEQTYTIDNNITVKIVILGDNYITLENINSYISLTYDINYKFKDYLFDILLSTTESIKKYSASNSGNIINKDGMELGGYPKGYYTDYIPIIGYSTILYTANINVSGNYVSFYDENKKYIPDISIPSTTAAASIKSDYIDITGNKYNKARYIRVNYYGEEFKNAVILIKNNSVLSGLVINALGDSITSTDYTVPNWWQMISKECNCNFNNYGVSGTSIAYNKYREEHFGKCFAERVAELDTNADCVIVMGGTNDDETPRGNWNDMVNTTFYGALNIIMSKLSNNFTGKPILFCTPIQKADDYANNISDPLSALNALSSTDTMSLQLRAEAIKAKASQYGFEVLDLYNHSGINGADANKIYYRTGDKFHPSEKGQKCLKIKIKRELEDIN